MATTHTSWNPIGLGVLFDVDGVLVDSYEAHFQSWQMLADEQGWSFGRADFARTFGRTSRDIIHDLAHQSSSNVGPITSDMNRQLDERKEAHYRELIRSSFPSMDRADLLLTDLHQAGFAIAVGSSGPRANVQLVLEQIDPGCVVQVAITGDDVTRGKPDPQVFQLAAGRLGLPPHRCIVVEDAPAGIEAARAAKMKCVAVTSTGRTRTEQEAADCVVSTLAEITPALLQELLAR